MAEDAGGWVHVGTPTAAGAAARCWLAGGRPPPQPPPAAPCPGLQQGAQASRAAKVHEAKAACCHARLQPAGLLECDLAAMLLTWEREFTTEHCEAVQVSAGYTITLVNLCAQLFRTSGATIYTQGSKGFLEMFCQRLLAWRRLCLARRPGLHAYILASTHH